MKFAKLRHTGYRVVGTLATTLGYRTRSPVFIIGTGRCGTTLLVKILNSHPQLIGFPDEANELWHPRAYPFANRSIDTPPIVEDPQKFTEFSVGSWPDNHHHTIQRAFLGYHITKAISKTLFVKSAMISFMIPEISALFPDAKFIHIYRNGPSVVESLLKKEWDKHRNYFDTRGNFRLHCAKYWRDCILEIEKQRVDLVLDKKNAFLEFSYEELCENPQGILDNIAGFLAITATAFSFDIGKIVSQNYKVGDYAENSSWSELLDVMAPAMTLKDYL